MTYNPAEVLAEAMAAAGTTLAFGVPGGGPNLDVVGALDAVGIDFVLAHGETAACIMASTYGYCSGSVSPAIVTRGPGAASAVNGAAQATLDRQPLLLITDTVGESVRARVVHQRIDQRAMLAPVAKASEVLGNATTPTDVAAAIDFARSSPAGAVHLDYDASAVGSLTAAALGPTKQVVADDEALEQARALVRQAKQPVLIVGVGAVPHSAAIRAAVTSSPLPVLSTYQGVGIIPGGSAHDAGLFTNGASERALLEQADLIIAVGLDAVEPIPAAWTYQAPLISITDRPTTDDYLPVAVDVVGPIDTCVTALLASADFAWPEGTAAGFRAGVLARLRDRNTHGLHPVDLAIAAHRHNPEAIATVDAGAHFLAIMPFWAAPAPRRLLISNGLATMGYAVPAAIGASLANPERPVLALTGDGGLSMCVAELETIARLQLDVTVVVFNDSALSLIEIKQREGHGGTSAVRYQPIDFAVTARSMGLQASVARSIDEVEGALATPASGPRLIDARIDPSAYPHLIEVTRG